MEILHSIEILHSMEISISKSPSNVSIVIHIQVYWFFITILDGDSLQIWLLKHNL